MKKIFHLTGLILLFASLPAKAGEPEFTASGPATVKVGEQFQYVIEGNTQGNVELPAMPGFVLRAGPFTSFSTSTQWVNGKLTSRTTATYTYILTAGSEGTYTIPPATVKVKRDTYSTNEVSIRVVAAGPGQGADASPQAVNGNSKGSEEDPEVFLEVLPSKRSVYLGEQLVSELKIHTRVNTRPAANLKDIPYEGFYKHQLEPDQSASRERINGVDYITQVLQRHVIIPQKTGRIVIEPFVSEWTVPQKVQRRRPGSIFEEFFDDPFSDPFFDSYQAVPVELSTDPVAIDVKPLPPGAPEGFTGAVGSFKVNAGLSEERVIVNDALSLVITIEGTGNISLLGEPEVSFPPDHDVYETVKKVSVNTAGNRVSGKARFEYPIVARHAGSYRIAPVTFSWFDPVKGKYYSAKTKEFTFTVEKGEGTASQGTTFVPGASGEAVTSLGTDILDISREIPDFKPLTRSLAGRRVYWLTYLLLALIFAGVAVLLKIYFRRRADVQLTRNRQASRMARGRLKAADRARKSQQTELFYEETGKAIWGYLADKLGIELSELSREKVSSIIGEKGVEDQTIDELFRIIDDCEFSRYAPSAEKSDPDELYEQSVKLIRSLEQHIRK